MIVCNEWKLCIFSRFCFLFFPLSCLVDGGFNEKKKMIERWWNLMWLKPFYAHTIVENTQLYFLSTNWPLVFWVFYQLNFSCAFSASFHWVFVSKVNFYYDIWATVDICFRYLNVFIQLWFEKKTVFQSRNKMFA